MESTVVFAEGSDSCHFYRIPAMALDKDGNIVVKIMDTGVGFDSQKVLAEIDRGEKDAAGIKNLTFQFKRLLDADVKVESHIGAGTVVTITIPPAAV